MPDSNQQKALRALANARAEFERVVSPEVDLPRNQHSTLATTSTLIGAARASLDAIGEGEWTPQDVFLHQVCDALQGLEEQYESLKQERDLLVALDEIEPVAVLRAERDGLKEQLEVCHQARREEHLERCREVDRLERERDHLLSAVGASMDDTKYLGLQEQLESAREAISRCDGTCGEAWAALNPATKPELDVDDPQGFYDAVPDPAKGHNSDSVMSATPGPSPASSLIEMSEDEKQIRAQLEAENAESRRRVREALDPASRPSIYEGTPLPHGISCRCSECAPASEPPASERDQASGHSSARAEGRGITGYPASRLPRSETGVSNQDTDPAKEPS